jgi:hypothetical protein
MSMNIGLGMKKKKESIMREKILRKSFEILFEDFIE